MIEELAVSYAAQQTAELKQAYQSGKVLFDGAIPSYGEIDSQLTFKLLNSFSVLNKAEQLVKDQLKSMPEAAQTSELINQQIKKLITERPRKLQDVLLKNTREAYSAYTDDQLASLLAAKRLHDYKTALMKRDVQSIYSIGSTAWIIEQDKLNREALRGLACVEEYLARHASLEIVQAMLAA
jgi:glutamate synthase (NADPH/NADH) large chain